MTNHITIVTYIVMQEDLEPLGIFFMCALNPINIDLFLPIVIIISAFSSDI